MRNPHKLDPTDNSQPDASAALPGNIFAAVSAACNHQVPFSRIMAESLYGSGGYYRSAGNRSIGRAGDFFTSVSVGPLFGELLARHCLELWQQIGRPERFALVEQGAHDGQLMADLLAAARELDPALHKAIDPWIIEPLPELAEMQETTLGGTVGSAPSLQNLPADLSAGLFYCNELVDAFPVARVRHAGDGTWQEFHLTLDGFQWREPSSATVKEELSRISARHNLPEGYETEIHLDALDWMRALAASPFSGHVLIIDYGFLEDDYYHSDRTCGTLQAYCDHQKVEIDASRLGKIDLTAHVNFSRLLETAKALDMAFLGFQSQSAFLTRLAADWLMDIEKNRDPKQENFSKRIRQFQTLTHPGMLGSQFHALGLWKNPSAIPDSAPPLLTAFPQTGETDKLLRPTPRS